MAPEEKSVQGTFSALCIRRPVLTLVMSFVIIVLGGVAFSFLGIREFPAVNPPTITVTTNYSGASADVIETQITEPIESSINGVDGIRSLNSISREGRSQVTVEFNIESDLDAAANDVRDRVSRVVRQLPADADPPSVAKADANSFPVIVMTVQSDKRDLLEVNAIGTNLKERLETIPGVAEVRIWGERTYAMRILVDPFKLSARGLTLSDVRTALKQDNLQLPSGRIEGPQVELTVMAPSKLATPEAIAHVMLRASPEGNIRLGDVARVIMGSENERTILRMNGVPMVGLALISQPSANALDIAKVFYERFEQLKREVPEDVKIALGFDQTRFIERSILEVRETIGIAFILVMLVLFLFFRNWRTALIPALAIPISLVGGFFIMYLAGFTINVLTLLALVLAIGLVVDDAIVVLEAIYARIERGEKPMEAGFRGSHEIFFAIVATTVVLVAIFFPIVFLGGFTGRLFREFGIVLAGSVVISAFVSLTLTPMLSARLLRLPAKKSLYTRTEPFFEGMVTGYQRTLEGFLKVRFVAVLLLLGAMVGTVWLFMNLKTELAPMEDRNALSMIAGTPEGTSYESMDGTMVMLGKKMAEVIPDADILTVTSPQFVGGGGANGGFARILLKDPEQREKSQAAIADDLGAALRRLTDVRAFVNQDQTIQVGSRAGLPVQFVIQAPNFAKLREALPRFLEEARQDPTFLVVDENLKFNRPQLRVEVDRDRARALGASVGDVAEALQLAYGEPRLDYFIMDSRQYNVIGLLDESFRDEPSDLLSIPVRNKDGQLIPLSNLVRLKEESGPPQLYRTNRYVSATVSAALAPGRTLGEGIDAMKRIGAKTLDPIFSTELAGPSRDFSESKSSLQFAFLMALLMVYLALAAQFESFRHPLTVMLTVPLALFGALASLKLAGQTLNIFSEIGLIMLIGLVTKNGILIVEFANQRREAGLSLRDAIVSASSSRFRPILMTSLTTSLGILPIALGLGAGSQSRIPMGIAVVGGILFSLVLTLYVIPAMYLYLGGKVAAAKPGDDGENDPAAMPSAMRGHGAVGLGLLLAAGLILPAKAFSQSPEGAPEKWPISLQQAIEQAQARNAAVLAEVESFKQVEAQVTWQKAGFWPSVDATGGVNQGIQDTRQRRLGADADSIRNGARTTGYTAGINGNWTLFEGGKSPAVYKRLRLQSDMARLRVSEVKRDVAEQTALAYYAILRDREKFLAADTLTALTEERLKLVQARLASGGVSRQEVLAAESDFLSQQADRSKAKASLIASMHTLGLWVGIRSNPQVDMAQTFQDPGDPPARDLSALKSTLLDSSIGIRRSRLAERLADEGWSEALAELWPKLSVSAGYNYALTRSQAGLISLNESVGPSVGAQIKFNLIPLGTLPAEARRARAAARETALRSAWAAQSATQDFERSVHLLEGCREALEMERKNRTLSAEAARLMHERLKAGDVSQVEAYLSEERYVSAVQRSVGQLYDCRTFDLQILHQAGFVSALP